MSLPKRLAVVTTHPIQYYAPVFQLLAKQEIVLKVFYTWGKESVDKYDPDFKRKIEWDIPLLEGYDYEFLENTSIKPGTSTFKGIVNPGAIQAIDKFSPDAILVYGWSWHSHLKIVRHYAGKKPVWFRGDSTLLDTQSFVKKVIRKILLTWVYRHIDTAFYVGTNNKKYFLKFGFKENKLRFSPHSVDNNRFSKPSNSSTRSIRQEFGLTDSAILILFAGKLEPKKDPLSLLRAFETVENQEVFLLFVGNGILEKELKEEAKTSSKEGQILFLNFQNQATMPSIYQACDIYCLPSVGPGETWGLAVNEAMACGKAILVSDRVGCEPDLVKPNLNGDVFKAGDVGSLSKKLHQLTSSKAKLQAMGEASAELIESWSFEQQIQPILNEIKNLK